LISTQAWQSGFATLAPADGVFAAPADEYDLVLVAGGGARSAADGADIEAAAAWAHGHPSAF